MRRILLTSLFVLFIFAFEINAREVKISEFMQDYIGVILGTSDYRIYNYWEEKGSEEIQVRDNSGGKSLRKTYTINDVSDIEQDIISIKYTAVNAAIDRVTIETEFELGDIFMDEFVRVGGSYNPRVEDEGNIVFSGTYRFDDYMIQVTEYKKEQKLSFTISMTSSFRNKNIRRY